MKTHTAMWIALAALLLGTGCFGRKTPDGSGTIECTQVDVAPLAAGRIAELPFQEGDVVRAGDVAAKLDPTDYDLKKREAEAGVAAARAQLDLLLAGSREEDILRASEQVREADALCFAAKADWRRIEPLFNAGSATEKQRDDARAQVQRTEAALGAAKQNLARIANGSRKEEIQLARAQLDQARARMLVAEKALADCVVRAPAGGTVTTRNREVGEFVGVGMPLMTLSRLDEVWLSVYVPESNLPGVKVGQPAWVRVDGDPKWYEGRVTYVSPAAEFTPRNVQTPDERAKLVYRVKIAVRNPQGIFKPGMPAEGSLEKDRS